MNWKTIAQNTLAVLIACLIIYTIYEYFSSIISLITYFSSFLTYCLNIAFAILSNVIVERFVKKRVWTYNPGSAQWEVTIIDQMRKQFSNRKEFVDNAIKEKKYDELVVNLDDMLIEAITWIIGMILFSWIPMYIESYDFWFYRPLPWIISSSLRQMLLLSNIRGTLKSLINETHRGAGVITLYPCMQEEPFIFFHVVGFNIYVLPFLAWLIK